MIAPVFKGNRMAGLMAYLVGPGRTNEHVEPHLVAGDPALMAWHDDNELGHDSAMQIAHHLDRPRTAYDVEVKQGHVWHCPLSISAEEGQLEDEQWARIAEDFLAEVGMDDHEGTKAPMRWAAVRHGLSKQGNDHIHLVVQVVREDGTKASLHNDWQRAQQACRTVEKKHGLQVLESAGKGRSQRGYKKGELEAHARRDARARFEARRKAGKESRAWAQVPAAERQQMVSACADASMIARRDLGRTVRACATSSRDEAEFVRRMRREGVLVSPRFADGRTDVVTGYKVAQRPPKGERPVWFGGGRLARDLTLPRLRQDWPDTPESATSAAAEWTAAKRHRRPVTQGREAEEIHPEAWRQAQGDLAAVRERLRSVPVGDRDAWAAVARETSGVFAAWSRRVGGEQGRALAQASDALALSAQTRRPGPRPRRSYRADIGRAAMLTASALNGGKGAVGTAVLIRQLATLAKTVHDAHKAAGEAARAQQIAVMEREQLRLVASRLPDPAAPQGPATRPPVFGGPAREPGQPLPSPLAPQARPQRTTPGAGRGSTGIER